jgi:hypothetical protein
MDMDSDLEEREEDPPILDNKTNPNQIALDLSSHMVGDATDDSDVDPEDLSNEFSEEERDKDDLLADSDSNAGSEGETNFGPKDEYTYREMDTGFSEF